VSLQKYQAKRKFQETPEPKGIAKRGKGPLRFVIQKHAASRLHFDLRLEAEGALKSWAVPKGPSVVPHEKRLAVMVEDHPLDYLLFEGTIPKGNYGAGTVMVWDEGTYHTPGAPGRAETERLVSEGLQDGRLHVVLHGKKLRGDFGLVRTKQGPNTWLLFKKDETPAEPPRGDQDRSVLSNRTMEEIAVAKKPTNFVRIDLSGAPKAPMPRNISPMLATPAAEPFDHPDWLFEVKWDGYRAIAEIEKGKVRLYSRNKLAFEKRYAPIVQALEHLGHDAVLDGEVVVLDPTGKPRFQLLQEYQKAKKGTPVYQVFDLLYLDGHDLQKLPLVRRKELLSQVLNGLPNVRLSEHITEQGVAFFDAVSRKGLEGIVAKDGRSRYQQGVRSRSWLKFKTQLRQEAVIGGFTEGQGARKGLGALVLGVYENGDLVYVGHAGTGFTDETLTDLRSRLDGLVQEACPFKKRPQTNAPVRWVEPRLVCEVSFGEWTNDGNMRHPVFLGLREDKEASMVRRERPVDVALPSGPVEPVVKKSRPEQAPPSHQPNERVEIGGHVVQLTNLNKVYWPEEGYTKGDLIRYYRNVSSIILPHLKDRPQSLHRHPNGIHGKSFFQKDVRQQPPPDWVETVEITSDSDGKKVRSVLCQDEATLAYLANLGCIELNPWNARVSTLDRADYLLLDLDPEDISFHHVVEAAQAIRKVLEQVGAESFCKTSGKRGLHVYVPFGARYSHDQAKHFAELIARIVNAKLPSTTSLVRNPSERQQRVYLDYLQNGKGKTLAAPYSVRPYPKATVSTPLKWSEVRRGLDPSRFTMRNIPKRLDAVGDLWKPILGPGIDLPGCLDRLASRVQRGPQR
jgi:bifunctional non-homologous end joining protein LigD